MNIPKNQLVKSSIFMTYVLRHVPEAIGLDMDDQGWVSIEQLAKNSEFEKTPLTVDLILLIAGIDEKGRYELDDTETRIRCVQGHSTQIARLDIPVAVPPQYLFHGTAKRFLESIKEHGLLKGARHYTHLSEEYETAVTVGTRHGEPMVFRIETEPLLKDGYQFRRAGNGVWLIENIPARYLSLFEG